MRAVASVRGMRHGGQHPRIALVYSYSDPDSAEAVERLRLVPAVPGTACAVYAAAAFSIVQRVRPD